MKLPKKSLVWFTGILLLGIGTLALNYSQQASAKLPVFKKTDPLPSNLFVELAKMVNPAVVNISTSQRPRQLQRRHRLNRDPFFDILEQFMNPQMPHMRPRQSLGTGFVIREDGLIITNNHVIDKADIIKVQLSENSKETYEAKIIGRDGRTDIALIKISAKSKLPTVKLGTSKSLEVGEWVAAFGNPFGHGHTMTKGIISAIGREIDELNRFPFLQTDASINPGNSGGPLVNTAGLVIGVNTAIDARAQGIGFAIPIDNVKTIIAELEKSGRIKRGYIGVFLADVDPSSAQSLGLATTEGALVTQTEESGPAEKAGLEPYDLIIQFGDTQIKSSRDLARAVTDTSVGTSAKVTVLRNGKEKSLKVRVAEHPSEKSQIADLPKSYRGQRAPFGLGFRVGDYSRKLAQEFQLPRLKKGRPVILDVEIGSPAAMAGLAPGDIVLDVNRKSVFGAKSILKLLQKGTLNLLRVLRQDRVLLLYIKPGGQ